MCSALTLAEACSYFVLMESRGPKRRFPPPWRVVRTQHGFIVSDANEVQIAAIYCRDDMHAAQFDNYLKHLTSDEARRIANAVARLPELLPPRQEFHQRGNFGRWRASHPYHVALADMYVRGNWEFIEATCKLNGLPYRSTGERLSRPATWCVYEFTAQLDAILFWDAFEGRWLLGDEFVYPKRPDNLPKLILPKPLYGKRDPHNGWL